MANQIQILDHQGKPMRSMDAYRGARTGRELGLWTPPLRSADADLLPDMTMLMSRANDLSRNYALTSGAIQIQLDNIIGSGLRLSAKPDYRLLGMDIEWASEWSSDVEAKFRDWANNPACFVDAGRRLTFGAMLGLAYRQFLTTGEILATGEWIPKINSKYSTAIQMVDPARLSNPHDLMDSARLRKGVALDRYSAPIAYHIRSALDSDSLYGSDVQSWKRVRKETPWGRQQVLHIFEQERPSQTRGKSGLATVIAKSKMLERHQDAALESSIINSLYAATIESDFDYSQVADIFGNADEAFSMSDKIMKNKGEFYEEKLSMEGGGRIVHLLNGERLKFTSPDHPGPNFSDFEKSTLRHLAAGLNITYEQLARDYSDTNYSGARAGLMESWKFFTTKRQLIGGRFATELYSLWLEEAISNGSVEHPSGANVRTLGEEKGALTRCNWIGPGKGNIDPLKESKADHLEIKMGTKTLESACAERGLDWEENLEQSEREGLRKLEILARKKAKMLDLKLTPEDLNLQSGESDSKPDSKPDDDEEMAA